MMKTSEDNDMTDCIGIVYVENDTKILWLIGLGADCYENKIGQWRDRWYICGLRRKRKWVVLIVQTEYNLWRKLDWKTMWLDV